AQRILHAGVLSCRNEDELRSELADDRKDDALHDLEPCEVSSSCRERDVDVCPGAIALAGMFELVQPERQQVLLMDRDEQDVRLIVEGVLRAVPVMDIPVE